jgi:hypothetical protein
MKKIIVYLFLFYIPIYISGQNDKYFVFGLGFSLTSIKDNGQSPLLYNSKSPIIKLGFESYSENWKQKISVDFQYGSLKNRHSPDFYEEQPYLILGHINYSINRSCYRFGNEMSYSPGVFIDVTANLRMIPKLENSMAGYEMFPNIGYSQIIDKDIHIGNSNFKFSHSLQIPVVIYLMRSNYVSMMNYIDPKATYLGTILSSGNWSTINKLFRINTKLDFSYSLKNNNQLKLTYLWDYYRCKTINKSQTVQNGLILSTLFNF